MLMPTSGMGASSKVPEVSGTISRLTPTHAFSPRGALGSWRRWLPTQDVIPLLRDDHHPGNPQKQTWPRKRGHVSLIPIPAHQRVKCGTPSSSFPLRTRQYLDSVGTTPIAGALFPSQHIRQIPQSFECPLTTTRSRPASLFPLMPADPLMSNPKRGWLERERERRDSQVTAQHQTIRRF